MATSKRRLSRTAARTRRTARERGVFGVWYRILPARTTLKNGRRRWRYLGSDWHVW